MAVFALKIGANAKVTKWLEGISKKLASPNWFGAPFRGAIRPIVMDEEATIWVCDIEPIYPRFVFNVVLVFLLFSAATLQVIGWTTTAFWTYGFTGFGFLIVNMFWGSWFYALIVRLQVWRLADGVSVKRADEEALRVVAYGKV